MVTGFLGRNWKLIAALAGFAVVREMIQRRKFIELQGKTVLITGGSRGFGLAMATDMLTISARFLPQGEGTERHLGKESETPVSQSFLTTFGQKASQQYNEL